MTVPEAALGLLHRADGSATYSHADYSVICAVNGPVEVQRRDEIPDEAAIEVNIRPLVGVGGPKERHLELLLHSTLRHVMLTHLHPRTLVQLTLQFLALPESAETDLGPSRTHLHLLPALLNAASAALLHASVPLATTLTSCCVVTPASGRGEIAVVVDPSPVQIREGKATHVFAFAKSGEVLLAESEGAGFSVTEWERAEEVARLACLGPSPDVEGKEVGEGDVDMEGEERDEGAEGGGVVGVLKRAVAKKVVEGNKWRS